MSVIISIEGNIGCGKSTLIKELQKRVNTNIVYLQEPVDIWTNISVDNISILDKFYEDPAKYAFSFQMMAYISRLSIINKAIKENPNAVIISERCLLTDKNVFAKMLYDSNKIDPYSFQIYNLWFNEFYDKLPKHKHVYLDSNPENIQQRIISRNRKGENNIDINYLESCHKYHNEFLNNNDNVIMKIDMDSCINDKKKYDLLVDELENVFLSFHNI
jgi:deoxyadenosine/deoxycytidine kinase